MWTVDKAWKDDIRAVMERQGISQADLARTLKVSPGSLTLLFKPETKQSRLVPAIHRALGLSTPTTTRVDERDELRRRFDDLWRDLTPVQRELLLSVAAQMIRKE
jgi:transcriptional regulator with XRE-family HTH domain